MPSLKVWNYCIRYIDTATHQLLYSIITLENTPITGDLNGIIGALQQIVNKVII